jgi:hypothetical protein
MKMKKGICLHFNGVQNEACEAGISIRSLVGGDDLGWAKRTPCFKHHETDTACPDYEEPTEKEIVEWEEKIKKSQEGIFTAIAMIMEKTDADPDFNHELGKKKGCSGTIECPVCKSELHYSVAGGNNHIHGKCSRTDCLSWMM